MNAELLAAVRERLALGHTTEAIREELHTAGYTEDAITQVLKAATAELTEVPHTAELIKLPGAIALIKAGLVFAKDKSLLILILAIPLALMTVFQYLLQEYVSEDQSGLMFGVVVATLVALAGYALTLAAALRIVTTLPAQTSLNEAFAWARQHIWSLLWIYLLTMLVVYGGLTLLIIPGIILSFLVYFSQYVLAAEGVKGIDALRRSRELLRGYAWAVAGKLLQIMLLVLLAFLLLGTLIGVTIEMMPDTPMLELVIGLLGQLLSAGMTVVGLHIGMSLYRNLVVAHPVGSPTLSKRWMYVVLAWLGVIFLVLIAAAVAINEPAIEKILDEEQVTASSTEAKARAVELRAEPTVVEPAETNGEGGVQPGT